MLVADQREVTGNGRGKSEMRKKLEAVDKFDVRFITLNISDFCFLRENKGFSFYWEALADTIFFLVRVLIERKRIDDLASSIKDKRYAEQKKRLKECAQLAPTRPIYLIEQKVCLLKV